MKLHSSGRQLKRFAVPLKNGIPIAQSAEQRVFPHLPTPEHRIPAISFTALRKTRPPSALASNCAPRQMPRTGFPREQIEIAVFESCVRQRLADGSEGVRV